MKDCRDHKAAETFSIVDTIREASQRSFSRVAKSYRIPIRTLRDHTWDTFKLT